MSGNPLEQAKSALVIAISNLHSGDAFSICAFDDSMMWYPSSNLLLNADAANILAAKRWVEALSAGGCTDILTPYRQATQMMAATAGHARLPFVVLITDGAVSNELEICQYAASKRGDVAANEVRTYTFGIGPLCNKYFLCQLAAAGRGYSDVCYYPDSIQSQMLALMGKTANPILANITLSFGVGMLQVEIFPPSIPDLSPGAPLVVTGRYTGQLSPIVNVTGVTCTGDALTFQVPTLFTQGAPVKQVVCRHQLDLLVGKWWAADGSSKEALRQQVVATSLQSSIPCVFTQSIAYETNPKSNIRYSSPDGFAKPATVSDPPPPPPSPGWSSDDQRQARAKNGKHTTPYMKNGAAVVLGTGLVAAVAFGSIAATNSNVDIGSLMNALDSGGSFDAISNAIGGAFNSMQHFDVSGAMGTIGSDVGEVLGHIDSDATRLISDSNADFSRCCCFDVSWLSGVCPCIDMNTLSSLCPCVDSIPCGGDFLSCISGICNSCGDMGGLFTENCGFCCEQCTSLVGSIDFDQICALLSCIFDNLGSLAGLAGGN